MTIPSTSGAIRILPVSPGDALQPARPISHLNTACRRHHHYPRLKEERASRHLYCVRPSRLAQYVVRSWRMCRGCGVGTSVVMGVAFPWMTSVCRSRETSITSLVSSAQGRWKMIKCFVKTLLRLWHYSSLSEVFVIEWCTCCFADFMMYFLHDNIMSQHS